MTTRGVPPAAQYYFLFCLVGLHPILSAGVSPVLTGVTLPLTGPVTRLWTGPVTGLGVASRKDMGPEGGKEPGTRDWHTPPRSIEQIENITLRRTSYTGGKNSIQINSSVPQSLTSTDNRNHSAYNIYEQVD